MIAHGTYRSLLKEKTVLDHSLEYAEAYVNEPTVEANLEVNGPQSSGRDILQV